MTNKSQLIQIFEGERYKNCQLDEDALFELLTYQKLLKETAKFLWKQKHPDCLRLPNDFEKKCTTKIIRLHKGSTCVDMELIEYADGDEIEKAAELIADTCEAINNQSRLPLNFPKHILPLLRSYGKTLGDGESIVQQTPKHHSVRYSRASRERFLKMFGEEVQNVVTVTAVVTMANIQNHKMKLALEDGRHIDARFKDDQEIFILEALKDHRTIRLEIVGIGVFFQDGELKAISNIQSLQTISSLEKETSSTQHSIWDAFQEVLNKVPKDVIDTLPSDCSSEIEHYLYGTPKKKNDF